MIQPSKIERTPLGRGDGALVPSASSNPGGVLTARQYQILRLRALGYSAWEVGLELGLSEQTIKNHTQTTYKRLDAASFADALRVMGWLKVP